MNPRIDGAATPSRTERFEAIIVGGGQAGLAVAYHLAQRGVDYCVLTDEARVGDNWRRRWDSLRLFTPARYNGLPGMPFPAPTAHFADKDEVADYLERYADRFDLRVRCNARVANAVPVGDRFRLSVTGEAHSIEAQTLVVATGPFQRPSIPSVAQQLSMNIHQLHSSEYRNPLELPDGPVLVVGAGNSGAQVALELAQSRKVWLAGRDTGHLPRRVLGRDVFDWIWPIMTRASSNTRLGRRIRTKVLRGGDALIGIREQQLRDAGIIRVARLEETRGGLPQCDGRVLEPRVIVWCTGYRPDYSWIDAPITDPNGLPRHVRGVSRDARGLFFTGLRFQYRVMSSLLGGVGDDAQFVATRVADITEAALDSRATSA